MREAKKAHRPGPSFAAARSSSAPAEKAQPTLTHGPSGHLHSGTGTRWFQGCYADKDGLLSKLASLEARMPEAVQ